MIVFDRTGETARTGSPKAESDEGKKSNCRPHKKKNATARNTSTQKQQKTTRQPRDDGH